MTRFGLYQAWRTVACGLLVASGAVLAHPEHGQLQGVRGTHRVEWSAANIATVYSAGYPDSFGLSAFYNRREVRSASIENRPCVTANFLAFDVSDDFAHDIDETVKLRLTLHGNPGAKLAYSYDRNDQSEPVGFIATPGGSGTMKVVEVDLDRARFAGRGIAGTDIALATEGTFVPGKGAEPATFTLCGIELARSFTSRPAATKVPFAFRVLDENGKPTSARFGLYDQTGRDVIPGPSALSFQFYETASRQLSLRSSYGQAQPWPHRNRWVSYVDRQFTDRVQPGEYQLVVAKGPEYRVESISLSVPSSGLAQPVEVRLKRAIDLPTQGWQSGDIHIHLTRARRDNARLLRFLAAEDLHVSNLLRTDNIGARYYDQYRFGRQGRAAEGRHTIVPGVEGPRSAIAGHVIALNPDRALTDADDYLLYHRFLEAYRQGGATTGFAHVGADEFRASLGLALEVPLGGVDFVEIFQNGRLGTQLWYELLNLGFRIAPAAGSDFPYYDQPGAVRNYVATGGSRSADSWFAGLKAGRTFVTNGPIPMLRIDGREVGQTITLDRPKVVSVAVSAALNPDLGELTSIELVSCGKVVAQLDPGQGTEHRLTLPLNASGWIALRLNGTNATAAHTAPIYVAASDGRSWCKDTAGGLAELMLGRLSELEERVPDLFDELEYWDSARLPEAHKRLRPQISARIAKARQFYQQIKRDCCAAAPEGTK